MTRVAVDLAGLAEFVDRLAAFERSLTATHDHVGARVAELHATWQGDAAAAQAIALHEWSVALTSVQSALAALRRTGALAHANYTAAVAANRRMWAQ